MGLSHIKRAYIRSIKRLDWRALMT
jgi:hypothetical protein